MKSEFRTTVLVWVWRDTIIGKGSWIQGYFNADLAVFTEKKIHHLLLSAVPLGTYTLTLKKACINKCENCRGLAELAFVTYLC